MKFRKLLAASALALASSASFAAPALYFLVDGDTFTQPFSITNQSTQAERVTRFQIDLAPTAMVFDTADFGAPGNDTLGVPFTPVGSDASLTGLVAGGNPADGSTLLDLSFGGFDAGETFRWNIDIDGSDTSVISVFGNQLIGASVSIWFSNGERLFGSLVAVDGRPQASQLFITGRDGNPTPPNGTPEPGSLALAGLALLGLAAARRAKQA